MKIDANKVHEHHKAGLVTAQRHPSLPITVFNYTDRVQYDWLWDETLLSCRGLVLDDNGEVVARPFRKFFNIEEHGHGRPHAEALPWCESWTAHEKLDGSLIVAGSYRGSRFCCTRGTFTSEQALWANARMMRDGWPDAPPNCTVLMEAICPASRVVVPYDFDGLVILGTLYNLTGEDIENPRNEGWRHARAYSARSVDELLAQEKDGSRFEGWVIRFASGLRVKVKLDEYKRLHRLITQCSSTTIWEALSLGQPVESIYAGVPDEFNGFVKDTAADLQSKHSAILEKCGWIVAGCEALPDRKSKAMRIVAECAENERPVAFAMLDRKDASQVAWKMVKPEWVRAWGTTETE